MAEQVTPLKRELIEILRAQRVCLKADDLCEACAQGMVTAVLDRMSRRLPIVMNAAIRDPGVGLQELIDIVRQELRNPGMAAMAAGEGGA